MKRIIKLTLLIIPITGLIIYSIYGNIQRQIIAKHFFELKTLKWSIKNDKLIIHSQKEHKGELLTYLITVKKNDGTILFNSPFGIDMDMFGGGFIKAMQIDEDPEMELVFWRSYGEKFYLDLLKTSINKISFEKANDKVKTLALKWHRYNVMHQAELTIFIILSGIYYLFLLLIFLIGKLFYLFRKKEQVL